MLHKRASEPFGRLVTLYSVMQAFTNAAKVDINHQCGHNISENVKRLDSKLQSFGYDKYPKYKDALYSDIILEPGDQLFIPSKYWHYVQSVTPSFSVSHWW